MTVLTIRNLSPVVHQRLREQAAAHGRSMEAEARAILEAGVSGVPADPVTALRRFAAEVQPTPDELEVVFGQRRDELQRAVDLA